MKKRSTFKKIFLRKESLLVAAIFGLLLVFGCYEFKMVNQPTEANSNSTFDVQIVLTEDDDPSNDWSLEDGSLTKTGLFGVLLPEGWTIEDNIAVRIESADSLDDGEGGYIYPTSEHGGDFTLAYSETQTTMLNDSTDNPPPGYYWWGAESTEPLDMAFLDSLYFTVTVMTDDKVGEFYLQYAAGDVDYWERQPFDANTLTDPLPITISHPVNVDPHFAEDAILTYPNPTYGYINIKFEDFNGKAVDMLMYDIKGKQVMSGQLKCAETMLDVIDLTPGVYFLRLQSGNTAVTRQFIKK